MKNRPLVALAVSLAILAGVAGITLGVTTLLGVTFQGEGTQPAEGARSTGERNELAICIQALGADLAVDSSAQATAAEATAKSRIEAVLPQVATHPDWEPAGLAAFEPVIDIGCPSLPPGPAVPEGLFPIQAIRGHEVSKPSPYNVFVFILPPEQLEELVGASSTRTAGQEMICDKDHYECSAVTEGVYLSTEDLSDSALLTRVLENGLGLRERP